MNVAQTGAVTIREIQLNCNNGLQTRGGKIRQGAGSEATYPHIRPLVATWRVVRILSRLISCDRWRFYGSTELLISELYNDRRFCFRSTVLTLPVTQLLIRFTLICASFHGMEGTFFLFLSQVLISRVPFWVPITIKPEIDVHYAFWLIIRKIYFQIVQH